jgi:iron complex transport system substrate-binding protein
MRLLSLSPTTTEILYALGLEDHIIGVTTYCDYPESAKRKPKFGSWITVELVKIQEANPDLIFTNYFLPEDVKTLQRTVKIVHSQPRNLREVFDSILQIGEATNRQIKAEVLVKKMKTDFAQIRQKSSIFFSEKSGNITQQFTQEMDSTNDSALLKHDTYPQPIISRKANEHHDIDTQNGMSPRSPSQSIKRKPHSNFPIQHRPRVYMEEWPVPPFVSGNWVPELVEIAGGTPVVVKTGRESHSFDYYEIQKADPDLMIFHWCGYQERFHKDLVIKREGWKDLRAIREGRIAIIHDSLLNRPGPRLVAGAQAIQDTIQSLNYSAA